MVVHACVNAYMHGCMDIEQHAHACARVHICMCVCMHACMYILQYPHPPVLKLASLALLPAPNILKLPTHMNCLHLPMKRFRVLGFSPDQRIS